MSGPAISFFHEVTRGYEYDSYSGETWAESVEGESGHIKWHSNGHTVSIDYIETTGKVTMLGVRLLKLLMVQEKQNLDPGMMNESGKRLWRLFQRRYSL